MDGPVIDNSQSSSLMLIWFGWKRWIHWAADPRMPLGEENTFWAARSPVQERSSRKSRGWDSGKKFMERSKATETWLNPFAFKKKKNYFCSQGSGQDDKQKESLGWATVQVIQPKRNFKLLLYNSSCDHFVQPLNFCNSLLHATAMFWRSSKRSCFLLMGWH